VSILQTWEKANLLVQADSAGLLQYWRAVDSVVTTLKQLSNPDHRRQIQSPMLRAQRHVFTEALDYLLNRWQSLSCAAAVSATAYLAGHRGGELSISVSSVHELFNTYAYELLTLNKTIGHHRGKAPIIRELRSQLTAMEKEEGQWQLNEDERSKGKGVLINDPMLYYKRRLNYDDCALLSSLAVTLLSVAASEASVERTFSALKLQWTALRNQLNVKTVENLLQLQLNHPKLREPNGMSGVQQPSTKYFLANPLLEGDPAHDEPALLDDDDGGMM
jgi:hypothetical protein